ncbi:flagellar motor protein MotB [Pokkaliibacter sp. CJK22405]|uniref:OmpA/MotB family protein n=1 Tax=Pokkaliibacter sp. CJK22405 TaxID=3384615 RepID=UPI0039848417
MSRNPLLEDNDDEAGWMATYADLMSLLLVFFILLFSISTIEIKKFEEIFTSVRFSLNTHGTTNAIIEFEHEAPTERDKPIVKEEVILPNQSEAKNSELDTELSEMSSELSEMIQTPMMSKDVQVVTENSRLHIRVKGQALFDPASTDLSYEAEPILESLTALFKKHPEFHISVQGHTDNQPIYTNQFPSNWELSAVRATTVVRYFLLKGITADRFTAEGFADSAPLASNKTSEGRAENRRVEFVLEKIQPASQP